MAVSEMMTIPVSERVVRHAARVASLTQQRVEDVLAGWLDWAAAEIPVETLPDDEVLALCDLEMDEDQQRELSHLLAGNRESLLDAESQARLDELMQIYRRGLVRKAQALKVAVQRGLRPPLGSEPS
jgi:dsDNA-binding SOS-regulon protein